MRVRSVGTPPRLPIERDGCARKAFTAFSREKLPLGLQIHLQLAVAGLTTGAVYALIALGFTSVYRATNILNLAQGDFVMLGGLAAVVLLERVGLPYPVAAVASIALVTVLGMLLFAGVIRPLRNESLLILIMATIGASVFFSGSAAILFGTAPRTLPAFLDHPPLALPGGIRVPVQGLLVLGMTGAVFGGLHLFSRHTDLGKAMEAVSTDRLGADLVGIPRNLVMVLSFALSGAVGAVAGIFVTPLFFTQYSAGGILGLKGFTAAVIGGWGRYGGAVLGGFLLGVVESLSIGIVPAGYKDAVAFVLLLAILYVRPKGVLGSRALEEARK